MPFIPSTPGQGSQGFQQGWNMIMNLYGQRVLQEREERQKKQFDAQMAQQQKLFGLREKEFAMKEKEFKAKEQAATDEMKRQVAWNKYLEDYQAANEGKKPPPREWKLKQAEIWAGTQTGQKAFEAYTKLREPTAYKKGTVKEFKIGDEFVQHEYTGNVVPGSPPGWEPTGIKAPRYKPPGVTIITQEKRDIAKAQTEFKTTPMTKKIKDISAVVEDWDILTPTEKSKSIGNFLMSEAMGLFSGSKIKIRRKPISSRMTTGTTGEFVYKYELLINGRPIKTWTEEMY